MRGGSTSTSRRGCCATHAGRRRSGARIQRLRGRRRSGSTRSTARFRRLRTYETSVTIRVTRSRHRSRARSESGESKCARSEVCPGCFRPKIIFWIIFEYLGALQAASSTLECAEKHRISSDYFFRPFEKWRYASTAKELVGHLLTGAGRRYGSRPTARYRGGTSENSGVVIIGFSEVAFAGACAQVSRWDHAACPSTAVKCSVL